MNFFYRIAVLLLLRRCLIFCIFNVLILLSEINIPFDYSTAERDGVRPGKWSKEFSYLLLMNNFR